MQGHMKYTPLTFFVTRRLTGWTTGLVPQGLYICLHRQKNPQTSEYISDLRSIQPQIRRLWWLDCDAVLSFGGLPPFGGTVTSDFRVEYLIHVSVLLPFSSESNRYSCDSFLKQTALRQNPYTNKQTAIDTSVGEIIIYLRFYEFLLTACNCV
jgi:hypothetical protein